MSYSKSVDSQLLNKQKTENINYFLVTFLLVIVLLVEIITNCYIVFKNNKTKIVHTFRQSQNWCKNRVGLEKEPVECDIEMLAVTHIEDKEDDSEPEPVPAPVHIQVNDANNAASSRALTLADPAVLHQKPNPVCVYIFQKFPTTWTRYSGRCWLR